jgi:hypothetical protein
MFAIAGRARNRAAQCLRPWLAKWHVMRVWQGWSDDPRKDTHTALECTKRALDADAHAARSRSRSTVWCTRISPRKLDVAEQRYDLALPRESERLARLGAQGNDACVQGGGQGSDGRYDSAA